MINISAKFIYHTILFISVLYDVVPIYSFHRLKPSLAIPFKGTTKLLKQNNSSVIPKIDLSSSIVTQLSHSKKPLSLFSPEDNLCQAVVDLINNEKESINIAMYIFTNQRIADALLSAHQRGVRVSLIVDRSCITNKYNKVEYLSFKGIPVYVWDPIIEYSKETHGLLHHKFCILTKYLITGSFNYTSSATTKNKEHIIILKEQEVIKSFQQQFDTLQNKCLNLYRWREEHAEYYYEAQKKKTANNKAKL